MQVNVYYDIMDIMDPITATILKLTISPATEYVKNKWNKHFGKRKVLISLNGIKEFSYHKELLSIQIYVPKSAKRDLYPTGKIKITTNKSEIKLEPENLQNKITLKPDRSESTFPNEESLCVFTYDIGKIVNSNKIFQNIKNINIELYKYSKKSETIWISSINDGHDRTSVIENKLLELLEAVKDS